MENQNSAEELSTQEVKGLIDSIAEYFRPVFVFSGGEPLLRDDIFELAKYSGEKGLKTALASNGQLINQKIAEQIIASGIKRVSISLDSTDEEFHDQFRNKVGSHYRAIKAVSTLVRNDISTQINFTVTKKVSKQVTDMVKLAIELKVDALHFFLVVPVGCGAILSEEEMLSREEYEETLNNIYRISKLYEDDIFIKVTCAPQYYRILMDNEPEIFKELHHPEHSITKGCIAGRGICFISSTGKVYPCGYLPVEAGDIRNESFIDIWQKSEVFSNLRDTEKLEDNCRSCKYTEICGGCRARAYAATDGNYLGKDPDCTLNH